MRLTRLFDTKMTQASTCSLPNYLCLVFSTKLNQLKPDVSNGTGNTSGYGRSRAQVKRLNRLVSNKNGAYPGIFPIAGHRVGPKMCSQTGNTSVQKKNMQFKVVSGLAIDTNLEPYMRM